MVAAVAEDDDDGEDEDEGGLDEEVAWSTGQLAAEREDDCARFAREAWSTGQEDEAEGEEEDPRVRFSNAE